MDHKVNVSWVRDSNGWDGKSFGIPNSSGLNPIFNNILQFLLLILRVRIEGGRDIENPAPQHPNRADGRPKMTNQTGTLQTFGVQEGKYSEEDLESNYVNKEKY